MSEPDPVSTDERLRELERLVVAGDETARVPLEALYARAGAVEDLDARMVEHGGVGNTCGRCMGSGFYPARTPPVECRDCAGYGKLGHAPWVKFCLASSIRLLSKYDWPCQLESIAITDNRDAESALRGVVLLTRRDRVLVASVAGDDWIGKQLLRKWCTRVRTTKGRVDPSPRDEAALQRLGATTEPTPLVALWSGAIARCTCGHHEGDHLRTNTTDRPCTECSCIKVEVAKEVHA